MVSSLRPVTQQFLLNLNKISESNQRAQQQLTTGLRVNDVSDQPDIISTLLQARANLSSTQQINSNLSRVKTEVDTSEQALESGVQLYDKVQTLAAEASSGTQTSAGRQAIAKELQSVEQELVGLANTSVEGRHVFAGDTDQIQPYTFDATQPNPVSAYQGSTSTRLVQHPNGTTFSTEITAQQIFDSADPTTNVFASINAVVNALNNNDDVALAAANTGLSKVGEYLNTQLAFYGTTQNKVTNATDYGNTLVTQLKTQLGVLQDADETQAILQLTQGQTQMQSALASEAQIPRKTLFDLLG